LLVLIQKSVVRFEIVGEIEQVETIATGSGVTVRAFLRKIHGRGRWRKRKGIASVRLPNGKLRQVELPWYEAHGVGKRDFKIKRCLDRP
jgi:ribose 5-phosphate isomerase